MILLLNIYEREALILTDIGSFNKQYDVAIKQQGDVSMKADPKGFLKAKTSGQRKKFQEPVRRFLRNSTLISCGRIAGTSGTLSLNWVAKSRQLRELLSGFGNQLVILPTQLRSQTPPAKSGDLAERVAKLLNPLV